MYGWLLKNSVPHVVCNFEPDARCAYEFEEFELGSQHWNKQHPLVEVCCVKSLVCRGSICEDLKEMRRLVAEVGVIFNTHIDQGGLLHELRSQYRSNPTLFAAAVVKLMWIRPAVALHQWEEGVRPSSLLFNPISSARGSHCTREFRKEYCVSVFERSGTCASCGTRVPAHLHLDGVAEDAEIKLLMKKKHLFRVDEEGERVLDALYSHRQRCTIGIDPSGVMRHLAATDPLDDVIQNDHFVGVNLKERSRRDSMSVGHGRGCSITQPFVKDEFVVLRLCADGNVVTASLEQRRNFENECESFNDWRQQGDVFARVVAIHLIKNADGSTSERYSLVSTAFSYLLLPC